MIVANDGYLVLSEFNIRIHTTTDIWLNLRKKLMISFKLVCYFDNNTLPTLKM